ncbi:MAG: tetratricopeptide repeat protein, partial [Chthoniobacteraceae bacterium]
HSGRLDEALRLIEQAIAANPGSFAYHNNLGLLLTRLGRREEAVAAFRNAIRLHPEGTESHYNMGITLSEMGRAGESVEAYRAALRLRPDYALAQLNLGIALTMAGRVDDALAHYREVLRQEPGNVSVAVNLANLLKDLARIEEAIEIYRTALRHSPEDAEAHSNLGVALKDSGEIDAALECFRRSLVSKPNRPEVHSNLIFTSYFDPAMPPAQIAGELRRWNALHAAPLRKEWQPHRNDRSPERRLRIGYVSPDFRDHVVGRTLLPAFEAHDRTRFDLVCYSAASVSDTITARFRSGATEWRDTANLSDAELADLIRCDRIDILVDLSLHTAFHRLLTFARKPAPVQIAWLGYPGPTGLDAMDCRITDPFLDPPGQDNAGSFEEPLRLPDAWCCYEPPADSPAVSDLPAAAQGFITFGSFNNFAKINGRVLEVWARILAAVEGSRLLLVLKGSRQDRARRFLEERGVAADRVEFMAYYPPPTARDAEAPPPAYLLRYHRVDIALDPFPYNGMTTTLDALWMGVPVVALIGAMTLGRASFSLISNVGLPELAAQNEDEYVRLATELARDIPRLTSLRATLRERMKASPLLDAPRFARNLEAAYRRAWETWCRKQEMPAPA